MGCKLIEQAGASALANHQHRDHEQEAPPCLPRKDRGDPDLFLRGVHFVVALGVTWCKVYVSKHKRENGNERR